MRRMRQRLASLGGAIVLASGGVIVATGLTSTPAGAASCTGTTTVTCTYLATLALDTFVVPAGITSVTITADGAQGAAGNIGVSGGEGAVLESTFTVTPGSTLNVLVGGAGGRVSDSGGGGGGSFVYTTADSAGLLIAAAGGGGSAGAGAGANGRASTAASDGQNGFVACDGGRAGTGGNGGGSASGICPVDQSTGGGGGGLNSNGADGLGNSTGSGGQALANGGAGGTSLVGAMGGFGGGGGAGDSGGGGGGYNGGRRRGRSGYRWRWGRVLQRHHANHRRERGQHRQRRGGHHLHRSDHQSSHHLEELRGGLHPLGRPDVADLQDHQPQLWEQPDRRGLHRPTPLGSGGGRAEQRPVRKLRWRDDHGCPGLGIGQPFGGHLGCLGRVAPSRST